MTSRTDILDSWKLVRLGDVAAVEMGQSPPGQTVTEWNGGFVHYGGLPFIQGNAEFGSKTPEPSKWCAKPIKIAHPNDVLISVRAPVGQTNKAGEIICIGRGLAAIRFEESSQSFGWHTINHRKAAFERLSQGTTFMAIGGDALRSLSILLPPLSEQRAIAEVLDSIDEAIEATEAVVAATEQLRNALLHRLLSHGVPGWHSEWKEVRGIGTIPADWDVVRLGEVAGFITSGSRGWSRYFRSTGAFFVRSQNITAQGIDRSDAIFVDPPNDGETERTRIRRGDILISITGEPGKATIAKKDIGLAFVSQHVALVRLHDRRLSSFASRFLQGPKGHDQFRKMAYGQTRPGLNLSNIGEARMVRPSLAEQQAIAELLDSVDEAIKQGRAETEMLQSLKASTADALLTGRVRVKMEDFVE